MAILIINETQRHELEVQEQDSVLSVLITAQEKLWGSDVAIESLAVNGEKVETLDEETLSAIPGFDATLEVKLVSAARDINEVLAEGGAYLQKLENGLMELSSKIRMENDPNSYKTLVDAMNGLNTMIDLFDVLRANEGVPEDLDNEFANFLDELNDKSRELNDAQEGQDPVLIADILEYEFVEVAQQMKEFLDRYMQYLPEE